MLLLLRWLCCVFPPEVLRLSLSLSLSVCLSLSLSLPLSPSVSVSVCLCLSPLSLCLNPCPAANRVGRSKGFCFVDFAEPASAQAALSSMNGFELMGRKIKVRVHYTQCHLLAGTSCIARLPLGSFVVLCLGFHLCACSGWLAQCPWLWPVPNGVVHWFGVGWYGSD